MRVSIQDRINQQVAGRLYGYTGDDNSGSEEEDADDYNYDDDQVSELIKTDWFESLSKQIDDLSTKNKQLEAKNKRLSSTTEPNDSDLQFALTPDGILQAGLLFVGYTRARLQKNKHSRRVGWFKGYFGVAPTTVAPFFQDLEEEYPDMNFKDCLMTLNWVFSYETYTQLSSRWKRCVEYIGPKLIEYGFKMAKVAKKKLRWELSDNIKVTLRRSLDCITFKANEMRQNPSTEWFDYKTHSCGLKYESVIATRENQICSMRGPFIPSMHDITVFRGGDTTTRVEDRDQSATYFKVPEDELMIGDSGYNGEPSKIVVSKDEHSPEFSEFLARAKNRHETFHTRLKSFNILRDRFRHGRSTEERMRLHKMAVELVSGIVQYDYENGHPPFDIC